MFPVDTEIEKNKGKLCFLFYLNSSSYSQEKYFSIDLFCFVSHYSRMDKKIKLKFYEFIKCPVTQSSYTAWNFNGLFKANLVSL